MGACLNLQNASGRQCRSLLIHKNMERRTDAKLMLLNRGETLDMEVENVKCRAVDPSETGTLKLTNLRLIWQSITNKT